MSAWPSAEINVEGRSSSVYTIDLSKMDLFIYIEKPLKDKEISYLIYETRRKSIWKSR